MNFPAEAATYKDCIFLERHNEDYKTYPVFINYNKSEDISAAINYEDRFESPSQIIAI
ncbi:DUF3427 domain-containing protein [Clostridium bovifaecis]|uniref:DUF3427 domain-containing protein n=1 Tax=Clostridium bovifaecis TaxID=2184719 RepID=A0A6I6F123_9CLOT|nr:DUF3427 domain-containing protein [Clostridium bovifaecis]